MFTLILISSLGKRFFCSCCCLSQSFDLHVKAMFNSSTNVSTISIRFTFSTYTLFFPFVLFLFLWICKWISTRANTPDFIHRSYNIPKSNLQATILELLRKLLKKNCSKVYFWYSCWLEVRNFTKIELCLGYYSTIFLKFMVVSCANFNCTFWELCRLFSRTVFSRRSAVDSVITRIRSGWGWIQS